MHVPVSSPTPSQPWNPNHIVPMVDNVTRPTVPSMSAFFIKKDEINQAGQSSPFASSNRFQNLETIDVEDNVGSHPVGDAAPCAPTKENRTPLTPDHPVGVAAPCGAIKEDCSPVMNKIGSHLVGDAAPCAPIEENSTPFNEQEEDPKEVSTDINECFIEHDDSTPFAPDLSTVYEEKEDPKEDECFDEQEEDPKEVSTDINECFNEHDDSFTHGPLKTFMDVQATMKTAWTSNSCG